MVPKIRTTYEPGTVGQTLPKPPSGPMAPRTPPVVRTPRADRPPRRKRGHWGDGFM
jgi:hypothetical protein